ncbi:D-alanine aminotransferase [bacterium BMS3Abin03]|nr:D-alanine aminotransferase [bacterium BMS3Abin03]
MIVYINGKFVPLEEAKVSPFDRGFLFADGVYEAMRTYNGKLFRVEYHLQRLKRSLNAIELSYNVTGELETVIYELINKNNITGEAFIYLQITRGVSIPRTHKFPKSQSPTVFITANGLNDQPEKRTNGVKVITDEDLRWLRCNIKSLVLLPAVLSKQKAVDAGVEEAILIRNGLITEGTHTNFFAVKNKVVYTAPESNFILSGITRKVVLQLCNELDIKVKEEFIKEDELNRFDEYFITSTIEEVTPVIQIDDLVINNGKPGEITGQLQGAFYKLTGKE